MKYLRRFVWYLASRLLLICVVLGLMVVAFYYAMNMANIYVVLKDGMAYRGTFVSNPEGIIKLVEIQDNSIGRNAEELLRRVEAAQFVATHDGEVCPAKWKQGQATLKPSIDLVGKI